MTHRLYFNREREWPQCWSIDTGTQADEINVCGVVFVRVYAIARLLPVERRGDGDKQPYAWLDVDGRLVVRKGIAFFYQSWFDRIVVWWMCR